MNDQGLKKFDFRGALVRTVMIKGEPWWVAADVCAVLEIENSRDAIRKRLEKDDVDLADITDSMGLTAERSSAVAIGPLVGRVATCVLRRRPA
jgi:prophage antirepressor-like protein